ncbi:MAG: hypothetical protein DMG80_04685 [Acidobacteria bacterium]|nr:MAG: hypothetical protein DMG80_04685 [Acidobacteriota bacterium]
MNGLAVIEIPNFMTNNGVLTCFSLIFCSGLAAQTKPLPRTFSATNVSSIALTETSRQSIASEVGGAFMFPAKCDGDGNLYIRKYATDRPLLGPTVKIDSKGKRVSLFDPASFSQVKLDRADSFSPAPDGGFYQIAAVGIDHPQIYVLHFSPDGSPSTPIRLDADFQPFQFAAFANGNLLASGFQRDPQKKDDPGRSFTAVFSADGRLLAQLALEPPPYFAHATQPAGKSGVSGSQASRPTLDLSDAEAGIDGNIYALRRSAPALIYVISPAGTVIKTLNAKSHVPSLMPSAFHVSANRIAIAFWDDKTKSQTIVVTDAQSGRGIATYSDAGTLGPSFACYSADDGVFTFLHLGEGNTFEVIRAEAH